MLPRVNVKDVLERTPVLTKNPTFVETRGGRPKPLLKSAITLKFEALGGASGFLGKPLGAEAKTPDGRGRFRHFEGGSIYSTGETRAHEVHGAIRELWAALGFEQGFLGYPTTDELSTPDGRGRFNHFEGGSIYWTPETGAHEVHGAILELWAALGFEQGFLGYPTTDELSTPDGRGRFNHFEGGSIYWTPETGAHEVHGAIRELWAALGFEQGFLGYPTTDELSTPDGRGRFNHFEGGSVYWSPETGAHEVHGAIRELWAALGFEQGFLGYPTTDELSTPDGRGRFNHFEGGSIYWTPETGAHEVHGAIRELWAALGFEQSFLGYPTTDELSTPDGRFNHFEGGSVYWSPATGAHEIHGAILDLWFSLGAETSALGLPVTDELDTPDGRGRFSAFEGGVISWSAELGAAVSSLNVNEDGTPGLQIQGEDGSDQPAPIVRRRIEAIAKMDLVDDEDFTSDELSHAEQTRVAVITDGLPQVVLTMEDGAGGEVRVELQLTARALQSGAILVEGHAKLFEGTSEQTNDLDGQESILLIVPLDGTLSEKVFVNSDAGDSAEISLAFVNSAV